MKISRGILANDLRLKTEYQLLQYLNRTAMRQYVPSAYEWLEEVNGFLMEYLHYPIQQSRTRLDTIRRLASILKTLHAVELPVTEGIGDDRTDITSAIVQRFRNVFNVVQEGYSFWAKMPTEDLPKLEIVRRHYETYYNLLETYQGTTSNIRVALTHGDLAGDNIMLTDDERLVLVDWGEARISSPLTDIAYLYTYSAWSPEEIRLFIQFYFNDNLVEVESELSAIQILSKLFRYRSCIQALLWLKEQGSDGLDIIGREHFERQLGLL